MILWNKRNQPLRALPIAMSILAIAIAWPRIVHSAAHLGTDWNDFIRGAVFGLAIGLMLSAIAAEVWRRRTHGSTQTGSAPRQ